MVRGVVLRPGDTFSFNNFIGERTVEKGWVEAPTILDGKLAPSPGGGISQFMTTMFNAAWFAGLDFAEYQSHSIYITRDPFGREATISWPSPDLKVTDSTPYGLMIWPTYTETSITITIYSTKYFTSVTQGDQSSQFSGKSCSSITTPRIRTVSRRHGQDRSLLPRVSGARRLAVYRSATTWRLADPGTRVNLRRVCRRAQRHRRLLPRRQPLLQRLCRQRLWRRRLRSATALCLLNNGARADRHETVQRATHEQRGSRRARR